jgi:hypothetical protein
MQKACQVVMAYSMLMQKTCQKLFLLNAKKNAKKGLTKLFDLTSMPLHSSFVVRQAVDHGVTVISL